jgi:hypothetical protein
MAITEEQFLALVEEQGGGEIGFEKVEQMYRQGLFSGVRESVIGMYLQAHRERKAAGARQVEQGLTARGVVAAESQADTAKQSLKRANWAIAISIIAALVAVVDLLVKH